jgi:hypothetical protein
MKNALNPVYRIREIAAPARLFHRDNGLPANAELPTPPAGIAFVCGRHADPFFAVPLFLAGCQKKTTV